MRFVFPLMTLTVVAGAVVVAINCSAVFVDVHARQWGVRITGAVVVALSIGWLLRGGDAWLRELRWLQRHLCAVHAIPLAFEATPLMDGRGAHG